MNRYLLSAACIALLASCGDNDPPEADVEDLDTTTEDAGDDVADTADTTVDVDETDGGEMDAMLPDVDETDTVEADAADVTDTRPDFSGWDHQTPLDPPSLEWSTCEVEADGSLAAKAAYYDWAVPALHQVPADTPGHEEYSRVFQITCDGDVPTTIVADDELPTCTHNRSENNGLWTSLYIASQAYRYAATGEQDALDQVMRTLRGTQRMADITGIRGLFTRDFRDPSLDEQYCPESPESYRPPDDNMVGNHWVRVGEDGCFITWDPEANEGEGDWYTHTEHCTDPEYAGFCWQRNVSKDEYSGHFFAASVVAKVVDDEEAQALAAEILTDAADHLIASDFWIQDFDGRETRFGSAHPLSLDHVPGFNALLGLSWIRAALSVTGEERFEDMYYGCMLAEYDVEDCIERRLERGADFRTHLGEYALSVGCQINHDNVNIANLAYTGLILMEPDPELRRLYRDEFHSGSRDNDVPHDIWQQGNPHWNFTMAALMESDPDSEEDALNLVHDGVCTLYDFRTDLVRQAVDNSELETFCTSDRHGPLAAEPPPMAQRCSGVYEWWNNPLQIENCEARPDRSYPGTAYLLPYWMGRYYGFISEEM